MSGMSIEDMTKASYLLFTIAGSFGISAVVLFFLLDIKKCWKMVLKECFVYRKKDKTARKDIQTERLKNAPSQETVLLCNEPGYGQQKTVLLDSREHKNLTKL